LTMMVRGLRGATTAKANDADAILVATRELLEKLIEVNGVAEDDVASVLFTTTPDLNAVFPAQAAREMGWRQVALMGFQEIAAPNGVPLCIRILIHWNTDKGLSGLQHVYMHGAEKLRPDMYPKNKLVVQDNEGA
jgi:chorismate mutase